MNENDQLPLYTTSGTAEHTLGHIACPGCQAERRKIMLSTHLSPYQKFSDACNVWLDSMELEGTVNRARYRAPRTLKDNAQYVRALMRFFGLMRLDDIHPGHLKQYQRERSSGDLGLEPEIVIERCAKRKKLTVEQLRASSEWWVWTQLQVNAARIPVDAPKINREIGILQRILKRAGLWNTEFEEGYQPLLIIPSDVPRSMSPEEQARFLEVAASRQAWQFTYLYCLVALETTMNNGEMRGLHISDVNLYEQVVQVRAAQAKNHFRIRTIPLPKNALWAIDRLLQRARGLGSIGPTDFLFPYCLGGGGAIFDPRRPMSNSGIKRSFDEIRKAAGVPWLRNHDLRHCAITRMAEAGVEIATIMAIAGQISSMMVQHYTQISMQSKRKSMTQAFDRRTAIPTARGAAERRKVNLMPSVIRTSRE